jgi:WD40 repeat protein
MIFCLMQTGAAISQSSPGQINSEQTLPQGHQADLPCRGDRPNAPTTGLSAVAQPVIQEAHSVDVTAMAFSPASTLLATGSKDGTVKIWNASSGLLLKTISTSLYWVHSLAFSPHGCMLAIGSGDRAIYILDVDSGKLGAPLMPDSGAIDALAFSSDGSMLAVGTTGRRLSSCDDAKIHLGIPCENEASAAHERTSLSIWDMRTRRIVKQQPGTMPVQSLVFLPNLPVLAFSRMPDVPMRPFNPATPLIRVWNYETGEIEDVASDALADLHLFVSHSGRTLLCAGVRTIHSETNPNETTYAPATLAWRIAQNKVDVSSAVHFDRVWGVGLSPDDDSISALQVQGAISSYSVTRFEVSVITGQAICSIRTKTCLSLRSMSQDKLSAAASSPNGQWTAVANGSEVKILSAKTDSPDRASHAPGNGVTSVFFSGDTLAVGFRSGQVSIWNKEFRSPITSLRQPIQDTYRGVQAFALLPDSSSLLSVAADGGVAQFNLSAPGKFQAIRDSQSGSRGDGTLSGRRELGEVIPAAPTAFTAVVVSDDGARASTPTIFEPLASTASPKGIVASGGLVFGDRAPTGYVSLINHDGSPVLAPITDGQRGNQDVTALAFTTDSSMLAFGFSGGGVDLWSVAQHQMIARLDDPTRPSIYDSVTSLAFSADGMWVAAGSMSGAVRVWTIGSGAAPQVTHRFTLSTHTSAVLCLAFSSTEKSEVLGSGGADNQILLWDLKQAKPMGSPLEGHTAAVNTMVFAPHSTVLVSGGDDGTVRFWDTSKARLLVTLMPVRNGADWLATSPEGFFDGKESAWDQVLWQFNNNLFDVSPVEIGFRDFFYPNLLARTLHGDAPAAERSLVTLNRAQPAIRILSVTPDSANTVRVTVEAKSGISAMQQDAAGRPLESGVYDLRVFRNGQLVQSASRSSGTGLSHLAENITDWRNSHRLNLDKDGRMVMSFPEIQLAHWTSSGANVFTAYAFNVDRIKSASSDPFVYRASTEPKPVRRAWIITMGVNDNQYPLWNVTIAIPSARQIGSLLDAKLAGSYAVNPVALYSDKGLARKGMLQAVLDLLAGRPVSEDLRRQIDPENKIERATPDDLIVFYIASHGYTDPNGDLHLVPYDTGTAPVTQDDLTECFGKGSGRNSDCEDTFHFAQRTISSADLSDWWESIDAGQMFLIIDSCYSGAIAGRAFRPAPLGDPGFGQLSYDKRMFLLAAAQAQQNDSGDASGDMTLLVKALETVSAHNSGGSVADWLREVDQQWAVLQLRFGSRAVETQSPIVLDFSDMGEPGSTPLHQN